MFPFNVLIETYWNVNGNCKWFEKCREYGINRNILECKLWLSV